MCSLYVCMVDEERKREITSSKERYSLSLSVASILYTLSVALFRPSGDHFRPLPLRVEIREKKLHTSEESASVDRAFFRNHSEARLIRTYRRQLDVMPSTPCAIIFSLSLSLYPSSIRSLIPASVYRL